MAGMDIVYSVQQYVSKMTEGVSGMKALLLDKETTGVVSMVCSRSQVLEKEVFLFQRLDAQRRGQMLHLKAVVFLRPTRENIEMLVRELLDPKFGEYHLFFSNVLSNDAVRSLAQADHLELVKQLREVYADFFALSPTSFSLNLPPHSSAISTPVADRTRDGDQQEEALDFGRGDDAPPVVDIPAAPSTGERGAEAAGAAAAGGAQSVVLSPVTDPFFRQTAYSDFGSLHDQIHAKLGELKRANPELAGGGGNMAFGSIAEMQKFVERYPELNKTKDNVSKHVNLLHALSRMVDAHSIMEVSEVEQQLAAVQDHKAAHKQEVRDLDKLRLVCLYALRYQKEGIDKGTIAAFSRLLPARPVPSSSSSSASPGGPGAAAPGAGGQPLPHYCKFPEILLRVNAVVMQGIKGFSSQAAENAYMLHEPLLLRLLKALDKAKLPQDKYPYRPYASGKAAEEAGRALKRGPAEVMVFIVGGATYAEARVVAKFNEENRHVRVLLGGSTFLNSSSFFESLAARAAALHPPA
ncbi:Sec1-like protein [Baffinella frigidus]|nr:Sec1-like protein [Cryptophyta sp. CCMP2293]